jgi:hypothetical protein
MCSCEHYNESLSPKRSREFLDELLPATQEGSYSMQLVALSLRNVANVMLRQRTTIWVL